jgi:hypothetical protein
VTPSYAVKDRQKVTKYKDYELTEDVTTGEKTIQRMKVDDDLKYDASEYYGKPVIEETYMSYKPGKGQMDETMKGKTPPDEYIEDTSLIRTDKPAKGGIEETFDGVPDDVLKEIEAGSGNVPESFYTGPNPIKKADGGRIGFRVGGSGKKFIEKIFGKGSLDVMKSRDPELHKGMLEVVEMFRNRDKEGLKMYLQKFLPHMDDETIEAFIKGDAVDAAGQGKYGLDNIQGQLIRLGSGRDYAGKIKMVKDAENMRALDKFDVTDRKPNALGGIQTMLGE